MDLMTGGAEPNRWKTCELREWLNGDFMDEAFTEDQQQVICETENLCRRKGEDDVCRDKVTLLSAEEARRYFPEEKARIARATLTAIENGLEPPEPGDTRCLWLLRSEETLEPLCTSTPSCSTCGRTTSSARRRST